MGLQTRETPVIKGCWRMWTIASRCPIFKLEVDDERVRKLRSERASLRRVRLHDWLTPNLSILSITPLHLSFANSTSSSIPFCFIISLSLSLTLILFYNCNLYRSRKIIIKACLVDRKEIVIFLVWLFFNLVKFLLAFEAVLKLFYFFWKKVNNLNLL